MQMLIVPGICASHGEDVAIDILAFIRGLAFQRKILSGCKSAPLTCASHTEIMAYGTAPLTCGKAV